MRILLSTIGSRGDVQPLVALATQLKALGQDVHLCVPPDFREWIEGLGFTVTPIGPELRSTGKVSPFSSPPTPEQRRQMMEGTVAAQFETVAAAARGCDVIVAATALQIAARSIAERWNVPYVFAAYCPCVLPSRHHAPPVLAMRGDTPSAPLDDHSQIWIEDAQRWNQMWRDMLDARRTAIGLAPVDDVRGHIFGDRPWLAADPVLAPWPDAPDPNVFQTGAWILHDTRPLSPELEAFLDAGDPPAYFGFGSNRAPHDLGANMIASARALGRRAIVSRGWADLALVDDAPDCIAIGDVNQQALFARVAAVVHHGGAGTTTAAARAGAPQVVIPQHYDQHYWAARVGKLGIGASHVSRVPTAESLSAALERALRSDTAARAREIAGAMRADGAEIAARAIVEMGTRARG
jgi:vancomycin aglycone glucosyltransferase